MAAETIEFAGFRSSYVESEDDIHGLRQSPVVELLDEAGKPICDLNWQNTTLEFVGVGKLGAVVLANLDIRLEDDDQSVVISGDNLSLSKCLMQTYFPWNAYPVVDAKYCGSIEIIQKILASQDLQAVAALNPDQFVNFRLAKQAVKSEHSYDADGPCANILDKTNQLVHKLRWANTVIRLFMNHDHSCNHIRTVTDDNNLAFLTEDRFVYGPLEQLLALNFPIEWRPELDETTVKVTSETGQLAIENYLQGYH